MPITESIKETVIEIDLEKVLAPVELERFCEKAEEAGASSLTEHFKDVFLRGPMADQVSSI